MTHIRHSIDVNAPLRAAYNQWTQFEDFPRFMEGVHEVRQLDDAHLHWRADRQGREIEWDSEIVEQVPDQLIAWRDVGGPGNHGCIRFSPLTEDATRVELEMDLASRLPASDQAQHETDLRRRLEQDLMRFKQMLETQGQESGAWRGEIREARSLPQSPTQSPPQSPPFEV